MLLALTIITPYPIAVQAISPGPLGCADIGGTDNSGTCILSTGFICSGETAISISNNLVVCSGNGSPVAPCTGAGAIICNGTDGNPATGGNNLTLGVGGDLMVGGVVSSRGGTGSGGTSGHAGAAGAAGGNIQMSVAGNMTIDSGDPANPALIIAVGGAGGPGGTTPLSGNGSPGGAGGNGGSINIKVNLAYSQNAGQIIDVSGGSGGPGSAGRTNGAGGAGANGGSGGTVSIFSCRTYDDGLIGASGGPGGAGGAGAGSGRGGSNGSGGNAGSIDEESGSDLTFGPDGPIRAALGGSEGAVGAGGGRGGAPGANSATPGAGGTLILNHCPRATFVGLGDLTELVGGGSGSSGDPPGADGTVTQLSTAPCCPCALQIEKSVAPDTNCDGLADGAFVDSVTVKATECVVYQICAANVGNLGAGASDIPQPISNVTVSDLQLGIGHASFGTVQPGNQVCKTIPGSVSASQCTGPGGTCLCQAVQGNNTATVDFESATCAADSLPACSLPTSVCTDTAQTTCYSGQANTPTSIPTATSSRVPTSTAIVPPTGTATSIPTGTPTSSPTRTRTNTPTNTALPTNSPTNLPTNTALPTGTPANTNTYTPTNTPTRSPTNTPTNTQTPTNTALLTQTPTNTPAVSTSTPTNTRTTTPTSSPTSIPTNSPTNIPTSTALPTSTPINTNTATRTNTPPNTPTNTALPTGTPINTNTPTRTNTPADTPTNTSLPTGTPTNTNTPTRTISPASTPTNIPTSTPPRIASATATATASATATSGTGGGGAPHGAVAYGAWGDDRGRALGTDARGNTFLSGQFIGVASFGGPALTAYVLPTLPGSYTDIMLAKYAPDGSYLWANRYGGYSSDWTNGMAVDGSGNVILTGTVGPGGETPDSGLTGLSPSQGGYDVFIGKFSGVDGTNLWGRNFTSPGNEYGNAVAVDSHGDAIMTGQFVNTLDLSGGSAPGSATLTSAGNTDVFVAKYSGANGAYLWAQRLGGTGADIGKAIAVDTNGDVVVTGTFSGAADFGRGGTLTSAGGTDIFLVKLSGADGTVLWAQRFGGTSGDTGNAVAMAANNNIVLTGSFTGTVGFGGSALTAGGGTDVFLAAYTSAGGYMWSKRIGGTGYEVAYGLSIDPTGALVLSGQSDGSTDFGGGPLPLIGYVDSFVAKYSATGAYVWAQRFGGTSFTYNMAAATAGIGGNVAVTGYFQGTLNAGGSSFPSAGGNDCYLLYFAP